MESGVILYCTALSLEMQYDFTRAQKKLNSLVIYGQDVQ